MTDLPTQEISDEMARAFNRAFNEAYDRLGDDEPYEATRAGLTAALVASGWRREADVRAEVAKEIERMPYGLDDEGWEYLVRKAEEAGYVRRVVMRRRNTFSGDTAEVAYQYGYRRAAEVARATALEPVGALPVADGSEVCGKPTLRGMPCVLPADHSEPNIHHAEGQERTPPVSSTGEEPTDGE